MKDQTLGAAIARLRKERGMTQLELAQQMGVTDKAVSKGERDLSCPDIASIPRLAELFQVSADELLQVNHAAPEKKDSLRGTVNLALRAVALAMGVAAAVLSLLGALEPRDGMGLLGLGLAALALWAFAKEEK